MSKKVKIGIIGIGTIGSVHADAYAKIPDAEVVALCDILPDRLKEKAARHGIAKTYATHQELLAKKGHYYQLWMRQYEDSAIDRAWSDRAGERS